MVKRNVGCNDFPLINQLLTDCNLVTREWAHTTKIAKKKVSVFFGSHIRCKAKWLT